MSKHTAGPWHQYKDGGRLEGSGYCFGLQYSDVVWGPKGPGYGAIADCSSSTLATEESIANARLISAAPEMLDLLETLENDSNKIPIWLWEKIKEVIRKAKGGDDA